MQLLYCDQPGTISVRGTVLYRASSLTCNYKDNYYQLIKEEFSLVFQLHFVCSLFE